MDRMGYDASGRQDLLESKMTDVKSVIELLTDQLCDCEKRSEAMENELTRLLAVVGEADAASIQKVLDE